MTSILALPCPQWCGGCTTADPDDGAQHHISEPRVVGVGNDAESHLFQVEVERLDVPGAVLDEPMIRLDGRHAMTPAQARTLAAALVAAADEAEAAA